MRVQVLRVDVCSHQNLAAWEEPLRQFLGNSVCFSRGEIFLRGEGLDVLVGHTQHLFHCVGVEKQQQSF